MPLTLYSRTASLIADEFVAGDDCIAVTTTTEGTISEFSLEGIIVAGVDATAAAAAIGIT